MSGTARTVATSRLLRKSTAGLLIASEDVAQYFGVDVAAGDHARDRPTADTSAARDGDRTCARSLDHDTVATEQGRDRRLAFLDACDHDAVEQFTGEVEHVGKHGLGADPVDERPLIGGLHGASCRS